MAVISITIPDAQLTRVVDALCAQGDFDNKGGALTKNQFAKKYIIDHVTAIVLSREQTAAQVAAAAAAASVVPVTIT